MPALDFQEIAPAHQGSARDQFELFARDFLAMEGFQIVVGPDMGPDAGRDLVVREQRHGPGGSTTFDWLVSCKHKAGSGGSVLHIDEINLRDRLETHNCDGFIAFYSTVPSGTLATHLEGLKPKFGLLVYDREQIESRLLDSPRGRSLAARYFPKSFQRWVASSQYAGSSAPRPAPIHDRLFLRQPHNDFEAARMEAAARNVPLFVVVYDEHHSSRSRIEYCLGYFMEWESTKRLVDEHFVVLVGPSSDAALGRLVPEDDPLEECRWIVLDDQRVLRSEPVYANASEGRKRVREVLELLGRSAA